jgi:hypothetical protein
MWQGRNKRGTMDQARAEEIAANALAFLAADALRLQRFLASTGLGLDELRCSMASPATLSAALEHLLGDEPLLLVFAAEQGIAPGHIVMARGRLAEADERE